MDISTYIYLFRTHVTYLESNLNETKRKQNVFLSFSIKPVFSMLLLARHQFHLLIRVDCFDAVKMKQKMCFRPCAGAKLVYKENFHEID